MSKYREDRTYELDRALADLHAADARITLIEEAIRRHRRDVWGKGKVDHPEDAILYAALDGRVQP